jgi:L-malate glycosyltransferase|tara:strand:+ start:52225 stop:53475 length:1251 start_codon:yes stop_codon:yes gene_type:complete
MHILIIPSEEYVPNHAPMAGIFQHDQAKILQQKGHQIGVLSFTFKYSFSSLLNALLGKNNKHTKKLGIVALLTTIIKKTFAPFQSAFSYEIKDRIDVIRCDGFWGTKKSNLPLSKYEMWMKYGDCALSTYIEKYGKPDLIHAHNMIYAGLTFTAIGKKNNIPVVITEHSSQYIMGEVNNELKLKLSNTFNASKKIYAVSLELIKQLEQQFSLPINKIKCLPNVLDDFIECKPLSIGKNQRQKVRFLNIANLITLKGQAELIKAFAKIFKDKDNVELIIAGEGELKEELMNLIDTLHLNDKVKLIGLISREEVITQLDDCDVFVLPSHYETFGVVLIEALSRGVPVISTYCGGPECIVDESNGVLVQPKDVDELAQAMLKMYHEYSNYNKEQLRESVINLYGKEAFYKRVIEIYKSV